MKLKFYNREQSTEIPSNAWKLLAERSIVSNPFYEYWNLLPALKHLDQNQDVELVTAWEGTDLVGLFPICYAQRRPLFKLASVWKHDECYCTSPLIAHNSVWASVLPLLWKHRRINMLLNTTQTEQAFTANNALHLSRRSYLRAGLNCAKSYEEMGKSWQRKRRKVWRRLLRRSVEEKQAGYQSSSSFDDCARFFLQYAEMESQGWKGRAGSAIAMNSDKLEYYQSMIAQGCENGKVEMQKIELNGAPIAASLRLITGNKAFEVKTSYSEHHRELAPGVLLELLNMKQLSEGKLHYADSCTQPGNKVMEELWDERIEVFNSIYFGPNTLSKLAWFATKIHKKFYRSHSDTHKICCDRPRAATNAFALNKASRISCKA